MSLLLQVSTALREQGRSKPVSPSVPQLRKGRAERPFREDSQMTSGVRAEAARQKLAWCDQAVGFRSEMLRQKEQSNGRRGWREVSRGHIRALQTPIKILDLFCVSRQAIRGF